MDSKEVLRVYFDGDKDLQNHVKLTDKELDNFSKFDRACIYDNGLKWSNGAFCNLTIEDVDTEAGETGADVLVVKVECGTCDDTGSNVSTWHVNYDRGTEKFEGA